LGNYEYINKALSSHHTAGMADQAPKLISPTLLLIIIELNQLYNLLGFSIAIFLVSDT